MLSESNRIYPILLGEVRKGCIAVSPWLYLVKELFVVDKELGNRVDLCNLYRLQFTNIVH